MSSDPLQSAKDVAVRFIDYQPRTRAEVERRLERAGFAADVIAAATADLERAGLIDDARFSRDWVESRARRKGLGRVRLEVELRRKGIAAEEAREAVGGMDETAEVEAALALSRAKWRLPAGAAPAERAAERRRLAAFLGRRGYGWPIIEQVFARIRANDD